MNSKSLLFRLCWWLPFGRVPEISPSGLIKILEDPASRPQLLDVRTRREWRKGHIRGSVNIPIHHLSSCLHALDFDHKKSVVTICLTAHRSIPAVRLLRCNGYQDVAQLSGGMMAWRREQLPVERDDSRSPTMQNFLK